jgi:hypothetical protein
MIEKIALLFRRFGDEFFADLAFDVLAKLESQNINYFATYSGYYNSTKVGCRLPFEDAGNTNVVIFHMDYIENVPHFFESVRNSSKKFLLFSSQLTPEYVESDNLQIIHWGSDMLMQQTQYQTLPGVIEKTFSSDWHWVSLSLAARHHRVMAAMFLKGLGLDQHGHLRINPHPLHDYEDWHDFTQWSIGSFVTEFESIFNVGFLRVKWEPVVHAGSLNDVYPTRQINNVENFDQRLRGLYQDSAVEIVNETIFEGPGYHVTEKFLNSVYGLNLPIVLGQPGVIAHLRDLGFDMFDDVIDHRYDSIPSPFLRLTTAIKSNQRLLADREHAINAWHRCQRRLQANYEFAQTHLHQKCRNRVMDQLPNAMHWLST